MWGCTCECELCGEKFDKEPGDWSDWLHNTRASGYDQLICVCCDSCASQYGRLQKLC